MQRGVFTRRQQVGKEGSEVVLKSLLERRRAELHDLFDALDSDHKGAVAKSRLEDALRRLGLDPRREDIVRSFQGMNISGDGMIVFEDFVEMMLGPSNIIQRAINQHLAIPDFQDFSKSLVEIFHSVQGIDEGELPGEVPALTKVDPDLFGFSVCTVDGQIFHHGDCESDVTLQGVILPLLYCVACEELGFNEVHQFVGRRPSGERSDAFILTEDAKPHNPLTNAGGIVTASLLFEEFDTE